MADIIQPGTPAPAFRLKDELGENFTNESIKGQTAVFVFFPNAFSPVCTDQFQVYEEVLDDFTAQGAKLYGTDTDTDAIAWVQENLPFVEAGVNDPAGIALMLGMIAALIPTETHGRR